MNVNSGNMPPALVQDFWSQDNSNPCVNLDVLMPTGILIQMLVYKDTNLHQIKRDLWKESQRFPFHSHLKTMESYVFMCINQTAEREELDNERRRLSDVRPFQPILKLVEKSGNMAEKVLNSQIGALIGKGVHEFDELSCKNEEIKEFRKNMRKMCEDVSKERSQKGWMEQMLYHFPPNLTSDTHITEFLQSRMSTSNTTIMVMLEKVETTFTFRIPMDALPEELIRKTLLKMSTTMGVDGGCHDDYVLKVCGKEEYLLGPHRLSQFKYIRKMMSSSQYAIVKLVSKVNIRVEGIPIVSVLSPYSADKHRESSTPHVGGIPTRPPVPPRNSKSRKSISPNSTDLWSIEEDFQITVEGLKNVPCAENSKMCLRVGIFHGGSPICDIINTKVSMLQNGEAEWNSTLNFKIKTCDLPRMAKLCFSLYQLVDSKTKKQDKLRGKGLNTLTRLKNTKQEVIGLAWVNISVFDFRGKLQQGQQTLHMWPLKESLHNQDDILNNLGTVVANPMGVNAIALGVIFYNFNSNKCILYPQFEKILECAAQNMSFGSSVNYCDIDKLQHLEGMIQKNPLQFSSICEQEKEHIWESRLDCREHFPNSLPKVLSCVKWESHVDVAQMYALLQIWPTLQPEDALELLDFAYADKSVRNFAVKCLKQFSDSDLLKYLLQLVQVLKYESYLECDLVEFLLKKALNNKRIGHYFFWLLRSEMHVSSVSVRFGLILEAYCRGAIAHMKSLNKQAEGLEKLRAVNILVKSRQYNRADKKARQQGYDDMREILKQDMYMDGLSDLQFPVDPYWQLNGLRVDKCKYMDSKMRPLLLVWKNEITSQTSDDVKVIFKNGDDLRQDMLTLQIMSIMDTIWQSEGLDLRLNPYGCISTGHCVGMIEMVKESETIANIQKENANFTITSAFNAEVMFLWLKKHNTDEASLNRAVEEFTLSCAGYCVATYVLGIGDRHSDNIMLRKNGQLFHIDFGHFLGNFKSKWGVKRERVPFVLTNDFVYVITKGQPVDGRDDNAFCRFRETCERAFLILRRKGNLLITLFMMMLSTGIPELTSLKDIQYLSDTLALGLSECEAKKHFNRKLTEALKNSWKTSMNWTAHNLAKDNT